MPNRLIPSHKSTAKHARLPGRDVATILGVCQDAVLQTRKFVLSAIKTIRRELEGDNFLAERYENAPMSIADRLGYAAGTHTEAIALPTGTAKTALADAKADLDMALPKVRAILERDLLALDKKLDAIGAPWSPAVGRSRNEFRRNFRRSIVRAGTAGAFAVPPTSARQVAFRALWL